MKKRARPAQKKKPLDYPEETEGGRLAAKARKMANSRPTNNEVSISTAPGS